MKGERKTYKAINFDFDTKKLALARGSAPKCYYEIRKTMKRLGFDHRQGSGYVSREKNRFGRYNPCCYETLRSTRMAA